MFDGKEISKIGFLILGDIIVNFIIVGTDYEIGFL